MPKKNNTTELHYFSFSSDVLIKSCPLPKEMIHSTNSKTYTLTIEAVQKLSLSEYLKKTKKHMEYRDMEKMIQMIGKQLEHMESIDKGIPSFNLDDISVFYTHATTAHHKKRNGASTNHGTTESDDSESDDSDSDSETATNTNTNTDTTATIHFALTNDDKICDFNDTHQQLNIITPYKPEYTTASSSSSHKNSNRPFISPEFKEFISKKTLPYSIHFKSGYYSFGLLCAHCFVSKTFDISVAPGTNDTTAHAATHNATPLATATATHNATPLATATATALAPIKNTKIYWFLMRTLHENPSERRYICS